MRKLRSFAIAMCALALAFSFDSCKKENTPTGNRMEIGAEIDQSGNSGSKTELLPTGKVNWVEGDEIMLYSGATGETFTLTSGAGEKIGRFVGNKPGEAPYFASYQAESYSVENGFTVTVPTQQNVSIANGIVTVPNAGPMVGCSTDGETLKFHNVLSWLNIGLKGDVEIGKVELQNTARNMTGTVTVKVNENNEITSNEFAADGENVITVSLSEGVQLTDEFFYVSFLAPKNAILKNDEIVIRVYDIYNNLLWTTTKTFPETIVENQYYTINVADNVSTYKFSINAQRKQVSFSSGNVWCDANDMDNPVWHFESNQWEFPYTYQTGHVGHFFWTENPKDSYKERKYDTNPQIYGDLNWFTTLFPGWRGLTKDEWVYLLRGRMEDHIVTHSYTLAQVHGVNGLLLFPDGFSAYPTSITEFDNHPTTYWVISNAEFTTLEDLGCAFLPAAGERYFEYKEELYGPQVYETNSKGHYFTTTKKDDNNGWEIAFETGYVRYNGGDGIYYAGQTIRLVKEEN